MTDAPRDWSALAESGTTSAIRAFVAIYRVLGRRVCQRLLGPIAAYYYLRERAWRGPIRRHLERVWSHPEGHESLGRRPGPFSPFRLYREFAVQTFDRMLLWGGGLDEFAMDHEGSEHLFSLVRERRGGLLLGAHLGSFDMARTLARDYGVAINVVMFTTHAERINRLFEELDPSSRLRVLPLDPTSVSTAFAIKACLDRGELVAILADRVPAGSREETIPIEFLGRPVEFPRSPFLLACLVGCPTFVSLCVRTGPGRYFTRVAPLGPPRRLPRSEREKGAEELARAYVRQLEDACLRHPFQWFNFYDPVERPAS